MSTLFSSQKAGSHAQVPPLTSMTKAGKRLGRPAGVDAEIAKYLRIDQSQLIPDIKNLQNETVVFFLRHFRRIDKHLYGLLFQEICRRIVNIGMRLLWSVNDVSAEQIVSDVEMAIIKLVITEKPSLAGEMLEVTFFRAVERRIVNAVRDSKRKALDRRGEYMPGARDEDGKKIADPLTLEPDDRPGPEDELLQLDNRDQRHRILRIACRAVKDRRHLVAVILHRAHGWPIESQDPEKPDLVRRFNEPAWQIKYWIKKALNQMREALGVEI